MDDFKTIKINARSLPPGESRGTLVHVEQGRYGTFKYYYDKTDETYWYQSSGTEAFEKWIKEREKERKRCLRNSKNELKEISA